MAVLERGGRGGDAGMGGRRESRGPGVYKHRNLGWGWGAREETERR